MVQLLQQQLVRAQQRQKHQADKNRSERTFELGDFVYLKLQPYVQTSVATRACHKLSFRYFGPYQIIAKMGKVAYKLLLPDTTVHPVIHVSQLKKVVPPSFQVSTDLPHSTTTDAFRFPVKILQRRLKPHGDRLVSEVLIQWSSWPTSMATWELEEELKLQFPGAPAWRQAVSQGGRDVRDPDGAYSEEGDQRQLAGGESEEEAPRSPTAKHEPTDEARPKRSRKPNPRYFGPNWVA